MKEDNELPTYVPSVLVSWVWPRTYPNYIINWFVHFRVNKTFKTYFFVVFISFEGVFFFNIKKPQERPKQKLVWRKTMIKSCLSHSMSISVCSSGGPFKGPLPWHSPFSDICNYCCDLPRNITKRRDALINKAQSLEKPFRSIKRHTVFNN